MNQLPDPPPAVPDVPTPPAPKSAAWLGGYFIEASLGRLRVEAVISPGGRLVSFAEASARRLHDGDLALIEFFAEEMASAGIDGPHVVDLIATLPEDSQAARLLAAMWEQHPNAQPEPRILSASGETEAPETRAFGGIARDISEERGAVSGALVGASTLRDPKED